MSFPIFFKIEIKKGWKKSCDFVISNPVRRVNWRDLIVRALHSQWTAQIHINLSVHTPLALSAQTCASTRSDHYTFCVCTSTCKGPRRAAGFAPLTHCTELWKCSCCKANTHITPRGLGWPVQAKWPRQFWLSTCGWWGVCSVQNFVSWKPREHSTSWTWEAHTIERTALLTTRQYEGSTAPPRCCPVRVPQTEFKRPKGRCSSLNDLIHSGCFH